MRKATLMHKDIPTVEFLMNEQGNCSRVLSVSNEKHLPPSIPHINDEDDVNFWLKNRRVSDKRADVKALKDAHVVNESWFLPLHYLSLYDCYWVRLNENERWDGINLYIQPEMEDVFSLMEDKDENKDVLMSRDTGNMTLSLPRECRYLQDESDCNIFYLAIRTELTEQPVFLQEKYRPYVPTVKGDYLFIYDEVYYRFQNQASLAMEYIPADDLFHGYASDPIYKGLPEEKIFFMAIDDVKIPNARKFLSGMLACDRKYNVARNISTFGYFRDPDTLKPFGFAPLFLWMMA